MSGLITKKPSLAAFAAGLVLVACAMPVTSGSLSDVSKPATHHAIEIRDFEFSELAVSVQPTATITWTNYDIVPHTVTAVDQSWTSGQINSGESFSLAITDNMELNYFCVYHPMMKSSLE